jgi:hypothetical protein
VATGEASPNIIDFSGSLGDGISFYDLFAEGGIGLPTFTGSYNSGEYYNGPTVNPTGNLIAEGGDAYFNATYANSFFDQADEQNLNIFVAQQVPGTNAVGQPNFVGSTGVENFKPHSITLSGEMIWTLSDAVDYQLVNYFLPYVGDHGSIITGFNGSDSSPDAYASVSEAGGAAQRDPSILNTPPLNVIGSWQVVSFADLPAPSDAPEPRSWVMAGMVLLGLFGMYRRLNLTA